MVKSRCVIMTRVNVAEAKARLSELIDAALGGEEIVIARRNRPVVKLEVLRPEQGGPKAGVLAGKVWMSPDFDEPLADFADYTTPARPRKRRGKPRR